MILHRNKYFFSILEKKLKQISGIKKNLTNASILIIDDNSPDKTQEVIKELKKDNDNLFLIEREKKLGLDSAHKTAFRYAIENNFDYLEKQNQNPFSRVDVPTALSLSYRHYYYYLVSGFLV